MYKNTLRAFAIGILFSVSLLGVSYFNLEKAKGDLELSEAKEIVEKAGFHILTNNELKKFRENKTEKNTSIEEESLKGKEGKNDFENAPVSDNKEDKVMAYSLTSESGMTIERISLLLKQAKIIEDSVEFEQFLSEHDYSTKIQLGTFELNNQMSYDEIGRIITKS